MKKWLSLAACGIAVTALAACEDATNTLPGDAFDPAAIPVDLLVDLILDPVNKSDYSKIQRKEFACTSVAGVDIDGVYVMYVDTNVKVPGGDRVDFLAGFFLKYDSKDQLSYLEAYHGEIRHIDENYYLTAGSRIIPSDPPNRADENTTQKIVPDARPMLVYKAEEDFPKYMVVSMPFLDRGVTVLGCKRIGGKPEWMEYFDDAIEESIESYEPGRLSLT